MPVDNLFNDGNLWESAAAVTPPPFFTQDQGYAFTTNGVGVGDYQIFYIGVDADLPGAYQTQVIITANPDGRELYAVLNYEVNGTPTESGILLAAAPTPLGPYPVNIIVPLDVSNFSISVQQLGVAPGTFDPPTNLISQLVSQPQTMNGPPVLNGGSSDYDRQLCYDSPVDYDNGRFVDPRSRSLADIRVDVVRRLGYAAQINNLPPGMADLVNSFINDANEQLYERYPVMRLMRWWTWQTEVGQKFYDVPIDCTKYLDFRHVKGAWLQDDDAWFPLVAGINPILFNQTMLSLPQYYELRESIELWPVPDKPTYLLHLKGELGPMPMVLDDDMATVDARAVFLMALANAKAHYSQPDAGRYDRQLEIYIGNLTAGSHYSKRYVPNQPPRVGLPLPIRQVPGG